MKVKYITWHNNYDLTIGKEYTALDYNEEWFLIVCDDKNNSVLYRKNCFEIVR